MSVRIGLVGAGVMGAEHARLLVEEVNGCELVGIADADMARARNVANGLGIARAEAEGLALVRDPEVDAVLVASPDDTHFDLVAECIRLGKPVLCEKPLATTSEQCRRLVDAEVEAGKRVVQVGFMRRFDPGYLDLKAAMDDRRHGAPLYLHCIHRNAVAPHYLTSENIPLSSAVHEIDVARFLLGEDFTRATVRATRASSRAPGRRPLFFLLETPSGVLMDIEVFVDAQYAYDVRAELVFENGTVALAPPHSSTVRAQKSESHALNTDWVDRFRAGYRGQAEAWIKSLSSGVPCGASAWDGYVATRTAEECIAALKSGVDRAFDVGARPDFYA